MDAHGGMTEREYRKRRRLPGPVVGLLAVLCLNTLIQTGRTHYTSRDKWSTVVFLVVMAAAVARILLEQYRSRTRVTSTGVTAQWAVRSRSWTWQQVYDIRVEPAPRGSGRMAPQWLAYVYDFEGRRFLLPHLNDWQLDDPYAEVSDLCLAADPNRSLTWERRPKVEALIVRRAARRRAWTWAAYGALVMLAAMFVVDVWEIVTGRPEHPFLLFVCVPLASFALLGALLDWRWKSLVPAQP
ncbi:PH domain-containing protein [Streptomyces sp. CA-249302]|uniref:PH domain-containing protein n=1 Tax=Streptomyces sp. CA-249302 TaxID=3240058 RepID=UPI003D92FF3B